VNVDPGNKKGESDSFAESADKLENPLGRAAARIIPARIRGGRHDRTDTTYEELERATLELVKKESCTNWEVSDLLLDAFPPDLPADKLDLRLEQFLADTKASGRLGLDLVGVTESRAVALAFPPDERREDCSWEVHRLLKDKKQLLRDGMTVAEARAVARAASPAELESATEGLWHLGDICTEMAELLERATAQEARVQGSLPFVVSELVEAALYQLLEVREGLTDRVGAEPQPPLRPETSDPPVR
jgi:hypothetical protein